MMNARPLAPASAESHLAVALVALAAAGALIAGFGAGVGDLRITAAGGGTAAAGLFLLMAAGWIDPMLVVALSVPLPALYSTPALRIAADTKGAAVRLTLKW